MNLSTGEIHLWYLDLNTARQEVVEDYFHRLVPSQEKEQSDRFLFEPRRATKKFPKRRCV